MKKVLITGFQSPNDTGFNPVQEALEKLEGMGLKGGSIVTCCLPLARFEAIQTVISAIESHKPYFVISLSQALEQKMITTEHMAINQDNITLTSQTKPPHIYKKIEEDGPDAYFSTLPIKAIELALQDKGIPCLISNTSGSFISNYLFYRVQHFLRDTDIGHGFIHLPLLKEKKHISSPEIMSLDCAVEGLKIAAQAILDHKYLDVTRGTPRFDTLVPV